MKKEKLTSQVIRSFFFYRKYALELQYISVPICCVNACLGLGTTTDSGVPRREGEDLVVVTTPPLPLLSLLGYIFQVQVLKKVYGHICRAHYQFFMSVSSWDLPGTLLTI